MDVQRAEAAAERQMLRRRHPLIAHEQHQMRHPRLVDLRKHGVALGLAEIDAAHEGADAGRQGFDFDVAKGRGHGVRPLWVVRWSGR